MTRPLQFLLPTFVVPVVLAASAGLPRAQAVRRLTFREAVTTAVQNGSEIQISAAGIEASQARVTGAGAQRLPVLRVEANIQYWDKPLELSFAPTPGAMSMAADPGAAQAPKLKVRDQVTSQATVTLAQPISGLFVLHRLVALERAGLDASRSDRLRARLDTAQRASEAYLRLLQAQALEQVATKSVSQVEAQLARAQILEKSGVLGQVDVLRLTSGRDAARQAQVQARTGVAVARAGLALALELPAGTEVEVVDDFPDPPPPLNMDEARVAELALQDRPEVAAADQRAAQARGGRSVAKAALLPNVMGLLSYQHTEGQSAFMPKNAWFVGGTLSWDLWDWGKNWQGVKEADARARQAEIAARTLRDQLVFDARRRLMEARAAYQSVGLSRSSLQAAEEAYRIQSVRFEQGAATTTDVIDAELGVSRARTSYSTSRYDYYLAQAAVARAIGQLPGQIDEAKSKGATNAKTR
jgi:outer membrane protein TolC